MVAIKFPAFSLGASNLGNTLGATGVTGTRVVLAGAGNITLSQATDLDGGTITISGAGGGAGGDFSAGVSGGNTAGDTGLTGTQFALAGGNNITLSQATGPSGGTVTIVGPATVAQTVQTQNLFDLTISGNTDGVGQLVSSGTLSLAGGSNITLSQNGNAITIVGPGTIAETQTAISGVGNSQTTYTSGTVNLVATGNLTIASTTGQGFRFSVAPQSVQPETQTFLGGIIASDTTYTSGSVRFTGVGGGVTVSSNTGQRVDISVAAQTGTQFSGGLSNVGNTSGDTGTVGGRLLLAGGNNITVSGSTNGASMTVTISGPNVGGAQTGISGIANSQTTYTSGTVSLSELGAITIRSTTGNQFQFSVNSQSVQTQGQMSAGVSTGGNTSGDTGVTGTRLVFVGSNNITLSQATAAAGGTITISGPTTAAQTNQTLGMYALSQTVGQSSSTTMDARTLSINFDGIVSGGYSNGSLRISATTAAQTAESQSFGMSNIGNTSGTTGIASGAQVRFLLAGGNNITLSQSLNGASGTITISAPNAVAQTNQTLGMYAVNNTTGQSSSTTMDARTISVAGDGDVSVGYSAGSLRISAPVQTVESQSIGMSNIGNTSGTTGVASGGQVRFVFAGGNNVTLSQSLNGASGTITVSAFNQTGTQFSGGLSNVGNTSGDTGTVAGRLVLAGGNNVTLSGSTNGVSETITISAFNQTVESQSIGMSNVGNTSGTTGMASGGQVRFVFAGGNNITLSQSLNGASGTITISAPNLGAGAMSVGVSNLGNSAGATGITGTQLVLVGSDNITLSQTTGANGGTVSIIGGAGGGFSAGASNLGNTAGATGVSGTRMVLVGTNAISLSQTTGAAGNTVSIDGPATSSLVGASGITLSTNGSTVSILQTSGGMFAREWNPYNEALQTFGQQGQGTLHMQPAQIPSDVQMDRFGIGIVISNASNSSNSISISAYMGVYTKNVSTMSLVTSISTSTNFSGSGTAGSYSLYGGRRWMTIPLTTTFSQGDYYIGIVVRTTTGGGAGHSISQVLMTQQSHATYSGWSGVLGAATNATMQVTPGLGTYSVTTAGLPSGIAFNEITGSGTLVMQPPIFMARSGTV